MSLLESAFKLAVELIFNKPLPNDQSPEPPADPKTFLSDQEKQAIAEKVTYWRQNYGRNPKPVDILRQMHGWITNFNRYHTKSAQGFYKSEMHQYIVDHIRSTNPMRDQGRKWPDAK